MEIDLREVVAQISKDKGIDVRTAAYVHALGRIAAAVEAHGTKAYFSKD